jgi:hypothetical protein
MHKRALRWPEITARVAAAVFGSYAFSWGFAAAGVAALVGPGVEYHDAEMGVLMLALLVFLGLFLWSFVVSSTYRLWAVLAGGASLLFAAAWAIQRAILN